MVKVSTFRAVVYVGTHDKESGEEFSISDIERICQNFVDEEGLCVTVTPTEFIYTGGNEPGAAIGLIHYPRFPQSFPSVSIKAKAIRLAEHLLKKLEQQRLSIVTDEETIMLENEEKDGV